MGWTHFFHGITSSQDIITTVERYVSQLRRSPDNYSKYSSGGSDSIEQLLDWFTPKQREFAVALIDPSKRCPSDRSSSSLSSYLQHCNVPYSTNFHNHSIAVSFEMMQRNRTNTKQWLYYNRSSRKTNWLPLTNPHLRVDTHFEEHINERNVRQSPWNILDIRNAAVAPRLVNFPSESSRKYSGVPMRK